MKKTYKFRIIRWFIVLYLCLLAIDGLGIQIHIKSVIGNMIAPLLIFFPLLKIVWEISKDKNVSKNRRSLAKMFLAFFAISYFGGIIGTALEKIL